ncbi:pantoate--beta-alanine ligase [Brevibacillus daliensis]|uniref:pantoate--beta-alanine ligase n=1 Tax=Brevibacillus daliensis TaxID=2892995 RepID=UPI001E2A25D9|nr:pantoate--beta-alanine ligase [Brevibacillus daliensis]
MLTIPTIKELRHHLQKEKEAGKTIGFVPTMGYLHDGHISLVNKAKEETDVIVMSIFVNPLQFGPTEDLDKYPRDIERDKELARSAGVTYLFTPSVQEMYPKPMRTKVVVEQITEVLCGLSRPGHFDGVSTVVTKLFNIVQPDKAFFGQKDAQQVAVIEQMVEDMLMPVTIVSCPIYREADGLAMSSRNVYLSDEERSQALVLSQSLFVAKQMIDAGERDASCMIKKVRSIIEEAPLAVIDYAEMKKYPEMADVDQLVSNEKYVIALAVKFGQTRLIDNSWFQL